MDIVNIIKWTVAIGIIMFSLPTPANVIVLIVMYILIGGK